MLLAVMVKDQIKEADAAFVLNLIKQRDTELELILKRFSFSQLNVQEPEEDIIELADKESNKAVSDDTFKKKYERM